MKDFSRGSTGQYDQLNNSSRYKNAHVTKEESQKYIRVKQRVYDSLQTKVQKLQKQLTTNKIFMNMVIHDMRNPTNSIEFALKEVLNLLNLVVRRCSSKNLSMLSDAVIQGSHKDGTKSDVMKIITSNFRRVAHIETT